MGGEKKLQNYIMRACRRVDVLCHKLESRSSRGWPDLVLIGGGVVVFVEVKNPNGRGRLSRHQLRVMADIRAHGGLCAVVDSEKSVDELLGGISNQISNQISNRKGVGVDDVVA